MSLPAPESHVSENLAHPRHAPLSASPGAPGWGVIQPAGAQTAILAASLQLIATPRLAALRLLAEEHVAAHGGTLRPLGKPPHALLVRTARDHAEALDARLRLLLGEDAVASFDLPEEADALSECVAERVAPKHLAPKRLADERHGPEPGFAVALSSPLRPLLRLPPPFARETLAAALAELDAEPPDPPPLLALPLAALRDDAFLRFAARHRRRAGTDAGGLVAAVPLAELLAVPEAARRAQAALAHAGHRLAVALPPHALRLFDPSSIPASLLVTPWDPAWQRDDPALLRAGPARVLATGVDSPAALTACRTAGIGAIAGRATAHLPGGQPVHAVA